MTMNNDESYASQHRRMNKPLSADVRNHKTRPGIYNNCIQSNEVHGVKAFLDSLNIVQVKMDFEVRESINQPKWQRILRE